ncbi:sigma-70 family RNA polymerase sigma factor [Actinomadura sp. 7K507]|uniref:sigma-70 family RNA polymerase sigma factor n=1 Tax=Actinomadura sp. 7K507 TaxID=2530365 RepID=UPI00104B2DE5|nr:sigma-70 family RNA polymerase sigma factor [Actinomadura sp. 7K507]TDC85873.1 sigma-70 family RNA polymerase sigma factor [Actinomadura sp. 7K507]
MTESAQDFPRLASPYQRELMAYCYRMLGSVHDAEDVLQEINLRAWKGYGRFEGRALLRTWLYRIATTTCLGALESRARRPLPVDLSPPSTDPGGQDITERADLPWLEPIPDALTSDPAATVVGRESLRLAFIAALQHLPPRQRAVLLLRDVLKWRADEAADALGTTTVAVNSMLRRARARLERVAPDPDAVTEPTTADRRELLDRYVRAFEAKDIPTLVSLFTADASWEMPPFPSWFSGPEHIGRHLAANCTVGSGELRLLSTRANGQPALATYMLDDGAYRPACLQVLTLVPGGIQRVTAFQDRRLFATFGLSERTGMRAVAPSP